MARGLPRRLDGRWIRDSDGESPLCRMLERFVPSWRWPERERERDEQPGRRGQSESQAQIKGAGLALPDNARIPDDSPSPRPGGCARALTLSRGAGQQLPPSRCAD